MWSLLVVKILVFFLKKYILFFVKIAEIGIFWCFLELWERLFFLMCSKIV